MRIAHINVSAADEAGRTAVQLCRMTSRDGHKALFCHAFDYAPADVSSYRIGSSPIPHRHWLAVQMDLVRCWLNTHMHLFLARLTDRSGFFSRRATRRLVSQLELFKPDIVHLHTLHGYYLHLPTLFAYLKENDMPVVWTLRDSWAYTGHCACYAAARDAESIAARRSRVKKQSIGCDRWQAGCGKCVLKRSYPSSWLFDSSARSWTEKRKLFQGLNHMVLTTPSDWLRDELLLSYLKDYPAYVFPGGVDTNVFKPCASSDYMHHAAQSYGLDQLEGRKLVLSYADIWDENKGLEDLIRLAEILGPDYCVAAIGVDARQAEDLAQTPLMCIRRPGNANDLSALYTAADVFVSASRGEAFGTRLLEAMACGTPAVCYDAEALSEVLTDEVGEAVPAGNAEALAEAVRRQCEHPGSQKSCLQHAAGFDISDRYAAYIRLYEKIYRFSPAYRSALERAAGKERAQNEY